jgi:hypothetical protein
MLLVVDPKARDKNKNKILPLFDYVDTTPRSIDVSSNLQEFSVYEFKHLSNKAGRFIS